MIDLHSHILPGIDDGPGSMEESLELGSLYAQAGFSRVVTTPHWVGGSVWMPEPDAVLRRVAKLNAALAQKGIAVEVLAGMEIAMDGGLAGLLDQGRIMGIAGTSYVLVEPPFQQMPLGWEQVFFEMMSRGWRVLLAHPERCSQFGTQPEMLSQMVESGVFLQVNYGSFLGNYGKAVAAAAWNLVDKGCVHCLATDSHDLIYRHPGRAHVAAEVLEEVVGRRAVEVMSRENPEFIIEGRDVEVAVGVRKKRRWFGKWLK